MMIDSIGLPETIRRSQRGSSTPTATDDLYGSVKLKPKPIRFRLSRNNLLAIRADLSLAGCKLWGPPTVGNFSMLCRRLWRMGAQSEAGTAKGSKGAVGRGGGLAYATTWPHRTTTLWGQLRRLSDRESQIAVAFFLAFFLSWFLSFCSLAWSWNSNSHWMASLCRRLCLLWRSGRGDVRRGGKGRGSGICVLVSACSRCGSFMIS